MKGTYVVDLSIVVTFHDYNLNITTSLGLEEKARGLLLQGLKASSATLN